MVAVGAALVVVAVVCGGGDGGGGGGGGGGGDGCGDGGGGGGLNLHDIKRCKCARGEIGKKKMNTSKSTSSTPLLKSTPIYPISKIYLNLPQSTPFLISTPIYPIYPKIYPNLPHF